MYKHEYKRDFILMLTHTLFLSRDRYIPPKKIPLRKVPPGKFLLWKKNNVAGNSGMPLSANL